MTKTNTSGVQKMRNGIFSIALIFTFICATDAHAKPASKESILQLLSALHVKDTYQRFFVEITPLWEKAFPNSPRKLWDELRTSMNLDELIDLIVPVYQKYLTQQDVDAMLVFYTNPVGKKILTVMPLASQEVNKIGREWGEQKAREFLKRHKLEE